MAVEWMGVTGQERQLLLEESLETADVQRWLDLLRNATSIHGRTDLHAENPLAKLLQYGFERSVPEFDEGVRHVLSLPLERWEALVLMPFLLRAGYGDEMCVREWYGERMETLYTTACRGSYDFFLGEEEVGRVPKPWRGKAIYRDEFGHAAGYALPTCYDFYALAHVREFPLVEAYRQKREAIAAFLSDPRFQDIPDGYGWDKAGRRCYAAGRVFMACATEARLVLFADLGSRMDAARQARWFAESVRRLEAFQTREGRYLFPREFLKEQEGYHLYGGCHMGMGEERRRGLDLEVESTFWMMLIHANMGGAIW
jgi:hypothetical protein